MKSNAKRIKTNLKYENHAQKEPLDPLKSTHI